MPFVAALTLSHFRSHLRVELQLDERPLAIYGPNGSGKTNLLEAVSLLSPGRGLRRATAQALFRQPEAIGWRIGAEIAGHEIDIRALPETARSVRLDTKPVTQLALGELVPMVWLMPAMDRLWTEGAEGRRRFFDRITLSLIPTHGSAVLTYEKAMRERNRLLKEQVHDPVWYDAIEAQMGKAGAQISHNRDRALRAVMAAQETADTVFPAAHLTLVNSGPQTPEALCAAFRDSRRADLAAGRSLVGPHRADLKAIWIAKNMPAHLCSTGEQKALLISLILASARALAAEVGKTPIILLDEVAAHLDPLRRSALYEEICTLGAQAWMTGTEETLFEGLGDRAQRFQVLERDMQSHVQQV